MKDKYIKADMDPGDYPLGTKFCAISGGYWIKVPSGFKWCNGDIFPNIGGDWDGTVSLPEKYILNN